MNCSCFSAVILVTCDHYKDTGCWEFSLLIVFSQILTLDTDFFGFGLRQMLIIKFISIKSLK